MFCYEDAFLIKCFKILVTYTRKCLYFDWLREGIQFERAEKVTTVFLAFNFFSVENLFTFIMYFILIEHNCFDLTQIIRSLYRLVQLCWSLLDLRLHIYSNRIS